MSNVLALIMALNALNVHGTKRQCENIVTPLVDITVYEEVGKFNTVSIDYILKQVRDLRIRCERRAKPRHSKQKRPKVEAKK